MLPETTAEWFYAFFRDLVVYLEFSIVEFSSSVQSIGKLHSMDPLVPRSFIAQAYSQSHSDIDTLHVISLI